MILKIDPADVVSIPTDYNGAKGRCAKYEVIAEVTGDPMDAFASVVDKTYDKTVVAPIATPAPLAPQAAWPFAAADIFPIPGKQARPAAVKAATVPVPKSASTTGTYLVIRKFGGDIVAKYITLAEARELVAKNVRQKKAQLVIIDSIGQQVV